MLKFGYITDPEVPIRIPHSVVWCNLSTERVTTEYGKFFEMGTDNDTGTEVFENTKYGYGICTGLI